MFWNDIREKGARVGEMGWMPVYFVDAYANMNCVRITVYCVHNAYMQTIWWFSSRLTWRNFARKFEKENIRDIITSFIILCMALNQCRFGCAHEGRQHIRIKRAIKAHRPWNIMAFFLVRGMSPVCHANVARRSCIRSENICVHSIRRCRFTNLIKFLRQATRQESSAKVKWTNKYAWSVNK